MSWQVQDHFCKIMRRHDSFEKQYNDKTKMCGIEMLHDNFKVYGIVTYSKGIVMYMKVF
jgi:hypothetical protein